MIAKRASQYCRCSSILLLAAWGLGGCSRAPAVDILGSFFPAWLICFAVAIALTALTQQVLSRLRVRLLYPVLVYPSLTALFTFLLWIIFFH
ncbi:MAG TPA: YtcA family lipoprotein [Verrucomicrobiae bacterium]|jgi:YtcA family|nr:YtcA family lipoprotein [Verrucomicrobiae bacterium]